MKEDNLKRIPKALGLDRQIIGLKFISFRQEYETLKLSAIKGKVAFCYMTKKAMDGEYLKVCADNFLCNAGSYALGIVEPGISVTSGRSYYTNLV